MIKSLALLFLMIATMLPSVPCSAALESLFPRECEVSLSLPKLSSIQPDAEKAELVKQLLIGHLQSKPIIPLTFTTTEHSPESSAIPLIQDSNYQSFWLLEPLSEIRRVDHELVTAADFGRFVGRRQEAFVFVGDFEKMSVPVFDGFVINKGVPTKNISLKSCDRQVPYFRLDLLLKSLGGRISSDREFDHLSAAGWFQSTNHLGSLRIRTLRNPLFAKWVRHTQILANIFAIPLADERVERYGRELNVVLDMRNCGYAFDIFREKEVQSAIQEMVAEKSSENISLTLLWDSEHVIEFSKEGIIFHSDPVQ